MVHRGLVWTIGEYSYFCLLYYCIILKDKGLEGLKLLYEIIEDKIILADDVSGIRNPIRYFGTYCMGLGTLVLLLW